MARRTISHEKTTPLQWRTSSLIDFSAVASDFERGLGYQEPCVGYSTNACSIDFFFRAVAELRGCGGEVPRWFVANRIRKSNSNVKNGFGIKVWGSSVLFASRLTANGFNCLWRTGQGLQCIGLM